MGKNHMTARIAEGFRRIGWKVWEFANPGEIVRYRTNKSKCPLTGDDITEEHAPWDDLCDDISSGAPILVKISEAHLLSAKSPVEMAKLHQFIMDATDETLRGKVISLQKGKGLDKTTIQTVSDWSRLVFLLDTNFPSELERKKSSTSFRSRLSWFQLDHYSYEEIVEMLGHMLIKRNLRVHDSTIRLLAGTARGTARPLEDITSQLASTFAGSKNTINREEIFVEMDKLGLYPLGVTKSEIQILKYCYKPTKVQALTTLIPNSEPSEIRKSLSFLQTCGRDKDGNPAPFLDYVTGGLKITEKGLSYLASVKKDGFHI